MLKVIWFTNTPANADDFLGRELTGTGGWLKTLDTLIQNNVELYVVFLTNSKLEPFRYLNTNYIPVVQSSKLKKFYRRLGIVRFDYFNDIGQLKIIIDKINPDIIHVHGTENVFGLVQTYFNIPTVISVQGNINVIKYRYFSGIQKSKFSSFFEYFKQLIGFKSYLFDYFKFDYWSRYENEILSNCRYFIGRTIWDYRITRLFAENSDYFKVSEILREEFYQNCKSDYKIKNKQIVLFSTISDNLYKGFETIVHTIELFSKYRPNLNFVWKVAGVNSKNSLYKMLLKENRNFDNNLEILGSLDSSNLVNNLIECDVFIMPSHIENSSNSLSEAMILGLPVIGAYSGGTCSLIEDGFSGILVQDGDPWSLCGAILEILGDEAKRFKYGNNARNSALKRHDRNVIVNDLINVYKEIILNR